MTPEREAELWRRTQEVPDITNLLLTECLDAIARWRPVVVAAKDFGDWVKTGEGLYHENIKPLVRVVSDLQKAEKSHGGNS